MIALKKVYAIMHCKHERNIHYVSIDILFENNFHHKYS